MEIGIGFILVFILACRSANLCGHHSVLTSKYVKIIIIYFVILTPLGVTNFGTLSVYSLVKFILFMLIKRP